MRRIKSKANVSAAGHSMAAAFENMPVCLILGSRKMSTNTSVRKITGARQLSKCVG